MEMLYKTSSVPVANDVEFAAQVAERKREFKL